MCDEFFVTDVSLFFFSHMTSFIDDIRSREAPLHRAKKLFKVRTVTLFTQSSDF